MHSQLIRFKRGQLLLVPLLATLLAACGAPQATNDTPQATAPAATAGPTAAPAPTSASQASVEPTAAPAPTSAPAPTEAPTGAPVAGVLPAPLYMFDSQQQIVRLEANGTTLAPVTREPAPIMQYDISQADGALLYVVGLQPQQKLVRVDARGGDREELLSGTLVGPAWAPDGQSYAIGWEDGPDGPGVYAAPASGGRPSRIVADLPRPKDGSRSGQSYHPLAWSPNGKQLLMMVVPDFGPDAPAGDIGVVGLAVTGDGARPIELVRSGGDPHMCLDPSWSADSAYVYCANYASSAGRPALWRIAATGGQPEVLLASAGDEFMDVFNARQIGDQLYAFVGTYKSGNPAPVYAMQRLATDGTAPAKLRDDAYDATAVLWSLWAPDGRGAVIQKAQDGQTGNALIWAPADGSSPVTLRAHAFGAPEWGALR